MTGIERNLCPRLEPGPDVNLVLNLPRGYIRGKYWEGVKCLLLVPSTATIPVFIRCGILKFSDGDTETISRRAGVATVFAVVGVTLFWFGYVRRNGLSLLGGGASADPGGFIGDDASLAAPSTEDASRAASADEDAS